MIRVGVDYNPEHWDAEIRAEDVREMVRAGINTVRIAEFSWGLLEPREGEFDFAWLDEIIGLFSDNGIDIILCTPTNCAPLWMYQYYPDTLQVGRDGQRANPGIRGHRCITSKTFRRFSDRIVSKMADRYADHRRVIAWQIDNEPESNRCCCESCAHDFREWLKDRYLSTDDLNRLWGTDVWSGIYNDWDQINPPLGTDYRFDWLNPSYLLEHERWATEATADFLLAQAEIIRERRPDAVITTNSCLGPAVPDFHSIFGKMDVASYDNYPEVRIPEDPERVYSQAYALDLTRGYKRNSFWILEQLSGPKGCWSPMSPTPLPGMIKGYAWQTVARGADTVLFFRWRSAAKGAEMFRHGLFDGRKPEGRRYEEFKDFIKELSGFKDLDGTRVVSKVAILYSYDQELAFRIQNQTEGFSYDEQLKRMHDAFMSMGVNVDVVSEAADFSGYSVITAPTMFITDAKLVRKLEEYTEKGGVLIIGNRTGVKNALNAKTLDSLPGAFRKLCGCKVVEYDPIGRIKQKLVFDGGESYTVTRWCDILETEGAEVVARYADSFYAGYAAVTVHSFGKGHCYYIGTVGESDFYRKLARIILDRARVGHMSLPKGIEVSYRRNEELEYAFIFNNTDKGKTFSVWGQSLTLLPFEMKVFKREIRDPAPVKD